MLPDEAVDAAKREIEDRGYDLNNLKLIKQFSELNSLKKEQDDEISFFGRIFNPPSKILLKQFYLSIPFTIVFLLNLIFNFLKLGRLDSLLFFAFGLFFMIFNYISYKKKVKREKFVRDRIAELEDEI